MLLFLFSVHYVCCDLYVDMLLSKQMGGNKNNIKKSGGQKSGAKKWNNQN